MLHGAQARAPDHPPRGHRARARGGGHPGEHIVHGLNAARAYQARAADRNPREQEADVFRRATAALRVAETGKGDGITRSRAVADNRLLWSTLGILLRDPQNALPAPLR